MFAFRNLFTSFTFTLSNTTGATFGAGTAYSDRPIEISKYQFKSSENWRLICFPKLLSKQWNKNVLQKMSNKIRIILSNTNPTKTCGAYLLLKSIYNYRILFIVLAVQIIYLYRTNSPVVIIMVVGMKSLSVSNNSK